MTPSAWPKLHSFCPIDQLSIGGDEITDGILSPSRIGCGNIKIKLEEREATTTTTMAQHHHHHHHTCSHSVIVHHMIISCEIKRLGLVYDCRLANLMYPHTQITFKLSTTIPLYHYTTIETTIIGYNSVVRARICESNKC